MSDTPPADWYPDPADDTRLRYWDGSTWTEHTSPRPGSSSPPAPRDPSWPSDGPGASTSPPAPSPWLWQSIVATLFCCLPLGVVGIVFAAQSVSAAGSGDLGTAERKARAARGWTLASVGAAFVVIALGLALLATGTFQSDVTFS